MSKITRRAKCCDRDSDIDDELVGVLTAISIVTKRLSRRLAVLENQTESEGEKNAVSEYAD
jgi:hypothetical protein